MTQDPRTDDPADDSRPFAIQVSERMKRLPAYLFARINQLTYQKRRAGDDVIDMSMGNPSDPPSDVVIEKLAEAARDPKNHGYSPSLGIMSLRREAGAKYMKKWGVRLDPESEIIATLGSKEGFSHMCLALLGPGDSAIVPAPSYPAHTYGVALASGNAISLEVADNEKFLSNIAYTCQHLYPKPKLVILNYPHNPSTVTVDPEFYVEAVKLARRYGFMIISDLAYADVTFDGYQAPSLLATPGAKELAVEFTTMSKGYNMAGWRVGFCAGNPEMIRAGHDQGVLRLRHVPPDSDRRDHGPAARRCGCRGAGGRLSAAARRAGRRTAADRLGRDAAAGEYVPLGKDPRPLVREAQFTRIRHEAAGRGRRSGQPRQRLRARW